MAFFQERTMDVDDDRAAEMDSKTAARSCTTCSKAKAKCVRQPGREICERCVPVQPLRTKVQVLMRRQMREIEEGMLLARTCGAPAQRRGQDDVRLSLPNDSKVCSQG